jgi:hypothetical protein
MYSRRRVITGGAAGLAVLKIGGSGFAEKLNPTTSRTMEIDIKRNGSRPSAKGSSDWWFGSRGPAVSGPRSGTRRRGPSDL